MKPCFIDNPIMMGKEVDDDDEREAGFRKYSVL